MEQTKNETSIENMNVEQSDYSLPLDYKNFLSSCESLDSPKLNEFINMMEKDEYLKEIILMEGLKGKLEIVVESFKNYINDSIKNNSNYEEKYLYGIAFKKLKIAVFGVWMVNENDAKNQPQNFPEIDDSIDSVILCKIEGKLVGLSGKWNLREIKQIIDETKRTRVEEEKIKFESDFEEIIKESNTVIETFKKMQIIARAKKNQEFNISNFFSYPTKKFYKGEIIDFLRDGYGEEIADNGKYFYLGIWRKGRKTARCLILWKKEDGIHIIEGNDPNEFVDDFVKLNGSMTYYFPDGRRYEGKFENGLKEGKGTMYLSHNRDMVEFDGSWVNDKRDGEGKLHNIEMTTY